MKATAQAFAIQGLIKYHGLRNPALRIPYHDSISVCMKSLPTITTVSLDETRRKEDVKIDGKVPSKGELDRIESVLNQLRKLAGNSANFRVESRNPDVKGKGLGFSASGFAALGLAASRVLGLNINSRELSQVVRLGAGSASRSLVGGFSVWYSGKRGFSYAEQLASPDSIGLRTVIVPIPSRVKTESAHRDVVKSPFFRARLKYLPSRLKMMRQALSHRNVRAICALAEEDTLNLHAITMTGREGLILFSPLSIQVINEIRRLREEGVPVWFSLDTGPSVFANTTLEALPRVRRTLEEIAGDVIVSAPGGAAGLVSKHLY